MRTLLIAILGAGCTGAEPTGTYAVELHGDTSSCTHQFGTRSVKFEGHAASVEKAYSVPTWFDATEVQFDGSHVTFDLAYSLRYSDGIGSSESGTEAWSLDADGQELTGSVTGHYNGHYSSNPPYDCTIDFTVAGTR